MTDAPQPPPGWQPPPPPPTSPGGYPPPPAPASPPGWTTPTAPPPAGAPPPYAPAPPPPGSLPPPPGTPGYGYGYTPYGSAAMSKPLGGIATALVILLGLSGIASIAVAYALFDRASVLEGDLDFGEVQDADDLAASTGAVYLLLFLATVVLWLVWQFRHGKNAEALGKRGGLGAGWAIGGWFIPLANLVLGPLQLHQAAAASDPDAPAPERGRAPAVVAAWWALWIAQGVVGFLSGRLGFTGDLGDDVDLEEFRSSDQLGAVGGVITAAAAFVAIVMIRQLTSRQQRALAQRLGQPMP